MIDQKPIFEGSREDYEEVKIGSAPEDK